jgi:alpha-galactosidase
MFGDVPPAGEIYFGPGMGFGWFMGDHYQGDQVLLIKSAYWGDSVWVTDFRPPSVGGTVGWQWTAMLSLIHTTLSNLTQIVPGYRKRDGYELAGFVWFQGEVDAYTPSRLAEDQGDLVDFIQDVRYHLGTPDLPFVIGEMGREGAYPNSGIQGRQVERDVAAPVNNTIFAPTAFLVNYNVTEVFEADYHYCGRADVYVGRGFARNMLVLLGDVSAEAPLSFQLNEAIPTAKQSTTQPTMSRTSLPPTLLPPTPPPTLIPTSQPTV